MIIAKFNIGVPREISIRVQFATSEAFGSMLTLGCRALHYSGHGDTNSLHFEDGVGTVHPLPYNDLKRLLGAGAASSVRLVVVSACKSGSVGIGIKCRVLSHFQ